MQLAWSFGFGLALTLTVLGCGSSVDDRDGTTSTVEQAWTCGPEAARGHEQLVYHGVAEANDMLASEFGITNFFEPDEKNSSCFRTNNPLKKGNCATDFPDDEMSSFYGVSARDWHTSHVVQDLHFLRDLKSDSEAAAPKEACFTSRNRIIAAIERAMGLWNSDKPLALFWIGHATHTLQDSFAPPHTRRIGELNETLTDICTYGTQFVGVCYHTRVSLGDAIWKGQPDDPIQFIEEGNTYNCNLDETSDLPCLTELAQSAVHATAGFLFVVGQQIQAPSAMTVKDRLNAWFDAEPINDHQGLFDCSRLSTVPARQIKADELEVAPADPTTCPVCNNDGGCSVGLPTGRGTPWLIPALIGAVLALRKRRSRS